MASKGCKNMTIEYNDSQKVNQMIPLRTTDEKR